MSDTKRSLLIGGVDLVKGRILDCGKAMVSICDEIEPQFAARNPLKHAPFDSIGLIFRFGPDALDRIDLGRINKRYSQLEVAYELPMADVHRVAYDILRKRLRTATLDTLIAVSKKYDLPLEPWVRLKDKG